MLGPSLLLLRRLAGLTQGELAKATGLSRQHISRIESGVHVPWLRSLLLYLQATGFGLYHLGLILECSARLEAPAQPRRVDARQVGLAMARLRVRARLPRQDLARLAAVGEGSLIHLEHGYYACSTGSLVRVLACLNATLQSLAETLPADIGAEGGAEARR